jgi:hypothetical protein
MGMVTRVVVFFLCAAFGSLAFAACGSDPDSETRYVAPDGDDNGAGDENNPWRTLQHAADSAKPGDTIMIRDGVYAEALAINSSGNADDGPITFINYPGEHPVIDGSTLEVGRGFSALVTIRSQEFVRVEGLEIRNFRSTRGRRNPVGVFVTGSATHIEIVDNDIHHIEATTTVGQRDAHGIAVYGTSQQPITDILIDNNKVHDLILGTSESVVINGNVEGFVVSNNTVHDNNNIGIDIIGFEGIAPSTDLDRARDGVVRGNLVYNIDTASNGSYEERNAGGIYVDGGTRVVIEDNVVHHSNMGIEIASEHPSGDTSYITVRNNLLHNNHIVGIALGGYDTNRGRTDHCEISNNTLYHNDTDALGNGEVLLQFDVRNNTFQNNVVVAGPQGLLISNPFTENADNTFESNLYFTAGESSWEWRTEALSSWQQYLDASGNDTTSDFADPLFTDPAAADFALQQGSPALRLSAGQS